MKNQNFNYAGLKTATRQLVALCGGVEAAGTMSRVGKSIISEYQNTEKPDLFMPVDVAADLEGTCGHYPVTQAMARAAGGVFIKSERKPIVSVAESLPKIGKEVGDVFAQTARALADGKTTPKEAKDIVAQIDEAIDALITAREALGG